MPSYNMLCPECGLDKDDFTTYENFIEHNSSDTAIPCPKCGKTSAFYSLTHLPQNLKLVEGDVLNFYGPCQQEQWFRGFEGLGRRG